jgi:basic amino acid/polyamine antiporter, APA family
LTGPRVYFAMAKDGLFFRHAGDVAQSSHVPVVAIVIQAIWTAVLALSGSYEQILSYVTSMNFLFFGLCASCLSLIGYGILLLGVPPYLFWRRASKKAPPRS